MYTCYSANSVKALECVTSYDYSKICRNI